MTGNTGQPTQAPQPAGKPGWVHRIVHPSGAVATFCYLVVAIAGLIVLRATVNQLDFIGIGWLIALALIPLLPWALPPTRRLHRDDLAVREPGGRRGLGADRSAQCH